jgi:hypothetical protein
MFKKDHIIYLAGIIDGEGSIQIEIQKKCASRKINYYSVRLIIINTNIELMIWLKDNFGGSFTMRKKIENRKDCYKWNVFSMKAAAILEACHPYMIIKEKHARLIIQFMNLKDKDSYYLTDKVIKQRENLYLTLKSLNKTNNK